MRIQKHLYNHHIDGAEDRGCYPRVDAVWMLVWMLCGCCPHPHSKAYTYIRVCVRVCVCACVRACVCVCVRVCVYRPQQTPAASGSLQHLPAAATAAAAAAAAAGTSEALPVAPAWPLSLSLSLSLSPISPLSLLSLSLSLSLSLRERERGAVSRTCVVRRTCVV
jgi:hypothetical protein